MLHSTRSLILTIALVGSPMLAGATSAQSVADTEQADSAGAAATLVMEMAELLGDAQSYRVDMHIGYDAVQASGEKIEFGELRQVSLQRPSQVLNELQSSDGRRELILFDGEWITVSQAESGIYARAPQPGDIDATVRYFLEGLGMRLPLAAMLMSSFPEVLGQRLEGIEYVEETDILGTPTHHLAGRVPGVDFQVWIDAGGQALPLRIILTYRDEVGQPQFRANFSNWNFKPGFADGTFRFEPAAGAQEVPLVTHFIPVTESGDQP